MCEYAIEVENLCISYRGLKSYSIKQNLLHGKRARAEEFQAVKNVSFRVQKGEIVGLIGKNGSGKSTMLRAIAGIFSPNSGTINLHNHSVSLLSIGVGFQKELSGRDNILLSGMLLGFSEAQIREHMDEIIAFSELEKFIDAPVRTYSSGMHSKLAFSITAVLETDIILIDEVSDTNRTVVIVSHDMKTIRDLCSKVLWINDGEMVQFGDAQTVLEAYDEFMN